MKLNLGSGAHPLDGFENLDLPDWDWSRPLLYEVDSIEAITVSHALMYCPEVRWRFAFGEMYCVLVPGGIVRITEDATDDPDSERFGGWKDAVALTSVKKIRHYAHSLFHITDMTPTPTHTLFHDNSLIQQWHGAPPKVFHVEGRKL